MGSSQPILANPLHNSVAASVSDTGSIHTQDGCVQILEDVSSSLGLASEILPLKLEFLVN